MIVSGSRTNHTTSLETCGAPVQRLHEVEDAALEELFDDCTHKPT